MYKFFYIFDRISKAFRHELKRMIYKMIGGKDVIPSREEENVARNNVEINVVSVDVILLNKIITSAVIFVDINSGYNTIFQNRIRKVYNL